MHARPGPLKGSPGGGIQWFAWMGLWVLEWVPAHPAHLKRLRGEHRGLSAGVAERSRPSDDVGDVHRISTSAVLILWWFSIDSVST